MTKKKTTVKEKSNTSSANVNKQKSSKTAENKTTPKATNKKVKDVSEESDSEYEAKPKNVLLNKKKTKLEESEEEEEILSKPNKKQKVEPWPFKNEKNVPFKRIDDTLVKQIKNKKLTDNTYEVMLKLLLGVGSYLCFTLFLF